MRRGSSGLERLLTKAEAAEALSVSVRFIERCVLERRIRYVKLGKFVRIPQSGVAEFIEAGEVPARW
jgi:excisionase family DNA binding protein